MRVSLHSDSYIRTLLQDLANALRDDTGAGFGEAMQLLKVLRISLMAPDDDPTRKNEIDPPSLVLLVALSTLVEKIELCICGPVAESAIEALRDILRKDITGMDSRVFAKVTATAAEGEGWHFTFGYGESSGDRSLRLTRHRLAQASNVCCC